MSARRMFNAPEMSRTALDERFVGVASGAARRAFLSFLSMVLLQVLRWQETRPILSGVQARLKASRSALTSLLCMVHVPCRARMQILSFAPFHELGSRHGAGSHRHELGIVAVQKQERHCR